MARQQLTPEEEQAYDDLAQAAAKLRGALDRRVAALEDGLQRAHSEDEE